MLPLATSEWPVVKLRLIQDEHVDRPERYGHEAHEKTGYIRRNVADLLLSICGDVFAILLWSAVLMYALLLWYSHGKKEVDLSNRTFTAPLLMEFARPLSTVFTILYAATTARCIKSFALQLLQQGCSVRMLDRLFGSTTVGGTILTNLTLGVPRSFVTYLTVTMLLCLWTLSPLASQAILRIMSIQSVSETRYVNRTYMNVSDWGALEGSGSDASMLVVAPNTLINAALIAPLSTKDQPRDLWGNVKIPLLSATQTTSSDIHGEWREVTHNGFASYSSLIGLSVGLPIAGAPNASGVSSSMNISSWYWDVDCSHQPWTTRPMNVNVPVSNTWYDSWMSQFVFNWTSTVYTWSPPLSVWVEDLNMTRAGLVCNISCGYSPMTVYCPDFPARTYGIILDDGGTPWYGMCTLETNYVETEITCDGSGCLASRIRRVNSSEIPPPTWNVLDICYQVSQNWHPLGRFFSNLVGAFQSRIDGSGGSNSLVGFLVDPSNPFSYNYNFGGGGPTFANQSIETINQRLAQILNSYWMSNLAYNLTTGDWGDDYQDFVSNSQNVLGLANGSLLETSVATVHNQYGVFTCNLGWLTAFTISAVIALLTSISGLVVILRIESPILTMNVTTMVRDSRYVQLPSVTSIMDDSERSRRAGHIRVKFGDVACTEEVGHLAIAGEDGSIEIGEVRKGRLYT